MLRLVLFAGLICVGGTGALAQNADQPYAGLEERDIKALSDERRDDLLAGRGASFALAAELNGLPGPRHALDLGDAIELKDDQRAGIQAIFDEMQTSARALGAELVAEEAKLDLLFAEGEATPQAVEEQTSAIGRIEAELRATHLKAHLTTSPLLTRHQTMLYQTARGYGAGGQGESGDHHGSGESAH